MIDRKALEEVIDSRFEQPLAVLDPEMPLREVITDSFAFVELALELEDRFGLRLSDGKLQEVETVADFLQTLESCTEASRE